jgi:uncharacterized membrane protein
VSGHRRLVWVAVGDIRAFSSLLLLNLLHIFTLLWLSIGTVGCMIVVTGCSLAVYVVAPVRSSSEMQCLKFYVVLVSLALRSPIP